MLSSVTTRWWITLFSPGHSPPHVTTAARTSVGLKWSDARGPASAANTIGVDKIISRSGITTRHEVGWGGNGRGGGGGGAQGYISVRCEGSREGEGGAVRFSTLFEP